MKTLLLPLFLLASMAGAQNPNLALPRSAQLASAADTTLTLTRDGKPAATIVVGKSAGHIPSFAAWELQIVDKHCKCPECDALLDKENKSPHFSTGKVSGLFWTFTNAVAREIQKSHPDKFVATLAYWNYAFPPGFEVEPNILVGPCLQSRNWWGSLTESNDMAFCQSCRQHAGRKAARGDL